MAFVLRTTSTPPIAQLVELEQVVIVDQTGPVVPLGPATGAVLLVGEFLKGSFSPVEVTSNGQLTGTYGGISNLLSQAANGAQDGSGIRYEGNGMLALAGKSFTRLVVQRVDCDMVDADGVTSKAFVQFDVTIDATDQDPDDATKVGRAILIPAGTRFGDAALATATKIVALSQDIIIPEGTDIVAGVVSIDENFANQNGTTGATAFFVKGADATTGGGDLIDTVIDAALPNVQSTIAAVGISTVDSAGAGTDVYAPKTGASLVARIEAAYADAINKTRPNGAPMEDVTVIWAARRGQAAATIRTPLQTNAVESSSEGRGRVAIVSGPLVGTATGDAATVTAAKTEVQGTTTAESPGRSDRKIVTFPYVQVFSSTFQKLITQAPDSWMAATLSNFAEEKNPGARNDHIQLIQKFEPAFDADLSALSKADYKNMKRNGVACLRKDRSVGWQFQSGVTSVDPSVDPTRAPIKRRRMADFIQDGINEIAARYNKEPATDANIESMIGEFETFLSGLASPANPDSARIDGYNVDPDTGNEADTLALGIHVTIIKVRLLASLDTLVFKTTIGETVDLEDAA